MKKILSLLSLVLTIALFVGCSALTGEEIGRLPINQVTINDENLILKEISLPLKKNEKIGIWSDLDVQYEGDVAFRFIIEILLNGENMSTLEIDPTEKNITLGEVKTSIMGKTKWQFLGKNHEFTIEKDGDYTFKGLLIASENPTLKVTTAEVVIKK